MGTYFMDQYSLLHFAVGIVMYFWGLSLRHAFVLHTIFELSENTELGMRFINSNFSMWPGGKPKADSNLNILGDTVFALIGFWLARYVDIKGNQFGWYQKHIN